MWNQPGGPALIIPVWCHECEFDPNGNRTKFGQIFDGRFQGESIHLVVDGQGQVTERTVEDASTGETIRREVAGPLNIAPPSFLQFRPAPFLRPFDALDDRRCGREQPDRDSCNGGF